MNTKKILVTSIILNILQVIFIVIAIALVRNDYHHCISTIIVLGIALSIANISITVISYIYLQKNQYKSLLQSMKDLEELNLTLRTQRHDYLNQMQVVYGLLDMDEYQDAKEYMNSIFKEITKVSKALKTSEPAINALLQAKLQAAEKEGIDLYLDIMTDLKGLKIEPWELCKVLANIIDNAITALANQKEGQDREIHIRMEQTEESYRFEIANNGPKITEGQQKLVFNQGYTTKKEAEGHGMGLYIVSNIIKEANGTLEIQSDERKTLFTIILPK
ncbi:MAG: Spo0B domain-containing protein [Cellulosilyticum sp.]|nr:Spo0B domain-containing protein [Cellulosilyticum sp.]